MKKEVLYVQTNENKIPNKKIYNILILFSLIINILCVLLMIYLISNKTKTVNTTKIEKDVTVTETGISDAVEKVYDSVVVIKNYYDNKLYSTGTGFVFKQDENNGYILTNYHVIDNVTSSKVILTNDKEIDAKIIGGDEYTDIAVLSIPKDEIISIANMGEVQNMKLGDTTFAVGAPLDADIYSFTVTRGILSGKNRIIEINSVNNYESYVMEVLQTDTAINSGNSGGPLCNSNGEVIGITNMKIDSSSIEGMGFAIPIDTAIYYANKIINNEVIIRPYLGISMYDLQNSFFYKNQTGVYIEEVQSGSSAYSAGLKKGDIITKINDKEIINKAYLKYELYKHEVGDKITITYTRNNKENTVSIILQSNLKTT